MSDNISRQSGPDAPGNEKDAASDVQLNGLLNEFETSDEYVEPAISPPIRQDTSPEIAARPEQGPQRKLLPIIGIIVLLVVAGVAYFSATPDIPEPEQATTEDAKLDVANASDQLTKVPDQVETTKQNFANELEQAKAVVRTKEVITEAPEIGETAAVSKPLLADSQPGDTQAPVPVEPQPHQASASGHAISPQAMNSPNVWALNLISVSTQSAAEAVVRKLRLDGIIAEIMQVNVRGKRFYRVRIANLASRQAAIDTRAKLGASYRDAWINQNIR